MILPETVLEKFDPKPSVGSGFSRVFRDNFRPEVASNVISGAAIESVGTGIRINVDDSRSNRS